MYWEFVAAGYIFTGVVLIVYVASVLIRGRRLSRRVPSEKRRFLA